MCFWVDGWEAEGGREGGFNLCLSLRSDTFSLSCSDLGPIKRVLVRHDNSGVGPSWFLERVEVTTREGGGEGSPQTTRFPCGQWLEECEGCGGKLEVELVPEGSLDRKRNQKEIG